MNKIWIAVLPGLFLLLSGCGQDTMTKVMEDYVAELNEMVTIYKGINDETSALEAKPKLKESAERCKVLAERINAVKQAMNDAASPEESLALVGDPEKTAELSKAMLDAAMRLSVETERITKIPGLKFLMDGITSEIDQALKGL